MDFSHQNAMDILFQSYFAMDQTTGLPIARAQTLLTDGSGGIQWASPVAALSTYGASIGTTTLDNLPVFVTNTTEITTNTTSIVNNITNFLNPYGYNATPSLPVNTFVSTLTLNSTVAGLGTAGYISSTQLFSTVKGLGTAGYISSTQLFSTVTGLGTAGYVSSSQLFSTVAGLGTAGYISSAQLYFLLQSLGTTYGYISTSKLNASLNNLGTLGYVSSLSLNSTVSGLETAGYIKSPQLFSTVAGLGTAGYVSTLTLNSTLTSTFQACSSLVNAQFFSENTTGSIYIMSGATARFNGTATPNLVYLSSFLLSSLAYTGTRGVTGALANINGTSLTFDTGSPNMYFSSFSFTPSVFTPYMNLASRVFLDVYPSYIFSRTSDNTAGIPFLTISTMLQQGTTILSGTVHTADFVPTNYTTVTKNNSAVECSNVFQQPLRIQLSAQQLLTSPTIPISLVHWIPGGFPRSVNTNGLHSSTVRVTTPLQNSVFLTVHTPSP